MTEEARLLQHPEEVLALAEAVRSAPWVGLDTEFMRERTYRPLLCLLQLSLPDAVVCVDPLAVDLAPLLAALPQAQLVLGHALRQDLEILRQEGGPIPTRVFDTQVAATLLGSDDQIGYAALCAEELQVVIDKTATRTDWAARPLSAEQLRYAANDVLHLPALHQRLAARLEERGRSAWLQEDCARLAEIARTTDGLEQAQARLDHAHRLPIPAQKALAGLLAWREQVAAARNRPRQWIVPDEALLRVAARLPKNAQDVRAIKGLTPPVLRRAEELAAAAQAGVADPAPPPWRPRALLSAEEQQRLDKALAVVRQHATTLGIPASWLAPRRLIEQWVRGQPVPTGWRLSVLEDALSGIRKTSAA